MCETEQITELIRQTLPYCKVILDVGEFQMAQPHATRSIIDTHRHIFGPKLRQKLIENIGFDDSKPLPQVFGDEMFFYRESVDVDYSMEIQRQSGVTLCVNSYGGEVETFSQLVIKASTVDTLKFLNDESFELRDRFPGEVACMANAHALEESSRDVIDPLISNKEACCISVTTSYGVGSDQVFLDSPKAEWLWEYAQAKDALVHIHPPLVAIGAVAMQQYRLNEAVGRPFDTALTAARMIYSGVFDKYPKLKVLFVHMGGALAPVVCRLDWNWELNYKGVQNPPINKVDKNLHKPSEYFKSNIYVDTMGPSASCLKAMIEMCGVDRVLFGTDFGPVPMSPKVHIDLVNETITDAGDRDKIFSTNALDLLRLAESAPRLAHRVA
jgi:predicted TIM-barrel fold metal-dependent hydrolase